MQFRGGYIGKPKSIDYGGGGFDGHLVYLLWMTKSNSHGYAERSAYNSNSSDGHIRIEDASVKR